MTNTARRLRQHRTCGPERAIPDTTLVIAVMIGQPTRMVRTEMSLQRGVAGLIRVTPIAATARTSTASATMFLRRLVLQVVRIHRHPLMDGSARAAPIHRHPLMDGAARAHLRPVVIAIATRVLAKTVATAKLTAGAATLMEMDTMTVTTTVRTYRTRVRAIQIATDRATRVSVKTPECVVMIV